MATERKDRARAFRTWAQVAWAVAFLCFIFALLSQPITMFVLTLLLRLVGKDMPFEEQWGVGTYLGDLASIALVICLLLGIGMRVMAKRHEHSGPG